MTENVIILQKKASKLDLHENLEHEPDNGNIEYKIHIIDLDNRRFNKLATQMKWRMSEGKGHCYYFIGFTDEGIARGISYACMKKSIENLSNVSNYLRYTYEVVYYKKGISGGFCAKVFIVDNNSSTSWF
jgi:GTPase